MSPPLFAESLDYRDALIGRQLPPEFGIGSRFVFKRAETPKPEVHAVQSSWESAESYAIFCSISTACGFFSYFTSLAAIFSRYGRAAFGSLRFTCVRASQNHVSTRYSFSLK